MSRFLFYQNARKSFESLPNNLILSLSTYSKQSYVAMGISFISTFKNHFMVYQILFCYIPIMKHFIVLLPFYLTVRTELEKLYKLVLPEKQPKFASDVMSHITVIYQT